MVLNSPTQNINKNYSSSKASYVHNKVPMIDLQGDLYAILQTANILESRFHQGLIQEDFYFRRMKEFHSELINLQNQLQYRGKTLTEIQNRLPQSESLTRIIHILSNLSDMRFDNIAQQWQIDPYQFATATSQITSKFITILDYLHLVESVEETFLFQLIDELTNELVPWRCFYFILNEIRLIINDFKALFLKSRQDVDLEGNNRDDFSQNSKFSNEIRNYEDKLFQLFQSFQDYLRSISLH